MLTVSTDSPGNLLAAIKSAINEGRVTTWSYDTDGDFTQTPAQWSEKAWFRPTLMNDALLFGIVGQQDKPLAAEYYAVYHGRFIEMLATHFDAFFATASASATPQPPDIVKTKAKLPGPGEALHGDVARRSV